jgi:hypothetical protein
MAFGNPSGSPLEVVEILFNQYNFSSRTPAALRKIRQLRKHFHGSAKKKFNYF